MHTDDQVICPACAKALLSKEMLRDHIGTVHAETDKATVSVNSHYMKKHVRRYLSTRRRLSVISICCTRLSIVL